MDTVLFWGGHNHSSRAAFGAEDSDEFPVGTVSMFLKRVLFIIPTSSSWPVSCIAKVV